MHAGQIQSRKARQSRHVCGTRRIRMEDKKDMHGGQEGQAWGKRRTCVRDKNDMLGGQSGQAWWTRRTRKKHTGQMSTGNWVTSQEEIYCQWSYSILSESVVAT